MKKLSSKQLREVRGGACVSPAAPHLGDCPGICHASQIVFANTGHGIGGPDGFVCIV